MGTKKAPKKTKENIKEVWIPINDSTKLRVEVTEFKGVNRVDIREHIETDKYTGFTKKGINILTNYAHELRDALNTIISTIEDEDLINELEEDEDNE